MQASPPPVLQGALLPGSVSILSGPTHGGKSTILSQMLAAISSGDEFLDLKTRECRIFYLAMDHRWAECYASVFSKAGYPDVPHWSMKDTTDESLVSRVVNLVEPRGAGPAASLDLILSEACPEGLAYDTLLVIDPIQMLLGNINNYNLVARNLLQLGIWAGKRWTTIVGTAHTAKLSRDPNRQYIRAIDKVAGTTAQTGYCLTSMNLTTPDEGSQFYELTINRRTAPPVLRALRRRQDGLFEPASAVVRGGVVFDKKTESAALKLYDMIPDGGTTAKELAVLADKGLAIVYRHINQLISAGMVSKDRDLIKRRPDA